MQSDTRVTHLVILRIKWHFKDNICKVQNSKWQKECLLFHAVLSSKPKAALAHVAAATKQWHTQHGQAFPQLARKQFDPQFYPVPVVSNEARRDQRLLP